MSHIHKVNFPELVYYGTNLGNLFVLFQCPYCAKRSQSMCYFLDGPYPYPWIDSFHCVHCSTLFSMEYPENLVDFFVPPEQRFFNVQKYNPKRKKIMPRLPMTEFKILQFLKHKEKMYAFEIVKHSGGAIKLGTVYTTLQRMADKELVVSSQDPEFSPESKRNPKRWYTATDVGKEYLRILEDFHSIQEKYRLL